MLAVPGRRTLSAIALVALLATIALAGLSALTTVGPGSGGCTGAASTPPAADAERTIPAALLPIFASAEAAYGVPWSVLAAVN
jgi:hypothetical protein